MNIVCNNCGFSYDLIFISGLLFFGPNDDGSLDFVCLSCEERINISAERVSALLTQLETT